MEFFFKTGFSLGGIMFLLSDFIFLFLYFFLLKGLLDKKRKDLAELREFCQVLKLKEKVSVSLSPEQKKIFFLWKECQILSLSSSQKLSFLKKLFFKLEKLPRKRQQMQLTLFSRFLFFMGFCFLGSWGLRSFFLKHRDPSYFEQERFFFFLVGGVALFLFLFLFKFFEKKSSIFGKKFSPKFSSWLELYFLGYFPKGEVEQGFFLKDLKASLLAGAFYESEKRTALEVWIFEKIEADEFQQKRSFEFYPLFEITFYLIVSGSFFLPYFFSWNLFVEF